MKNGFVPVLIGSVCRLVNGRAFKPTEWSTEGIPIVRIQNLNDMDKPFNYYKGQADDKHLIDNGDVLLSWSGTPGTSFGCFVWNRGKGVVNQHIFKVHVDERKVDKHYFVFAVNSVLDEMIAQAHGGVGLRHITKGKLEALELSLHSDIQEQRRIVARITEMLDCVDAINSQRIDAVTESMYLLRALRREELGTANELPKWWKECRLDASADVIYGISAAIAKNRDPSLGPPIVRMANMSLDGDLDLSDLRYMPIPKGRESHFLLKKGDLLLNWRSGSPEHIGKTAIFSEDGNFTCASFILRIRPKPGLANTRYLRHVLNFMRAERVFQGQSRMQVNSKLNASEFSAFPIRFPPTIEEQEAVADRLDAAESLVRQIREQRDAADSEHRAVRKAILRKAFAGEL